MGSRAEKLYFASPIWFQNLMVTGYGVVLRNERYAEPHDTHLAEIESGSEPDSPQMLERQWTLCRDLLNHAFKTVPHFRELTAEQGITIDDFQGFSDLGKLPIMEKEDMRRNHLRFRSESFKPSETFILHTSGTTGTALTVYSDKVSRRKHYAFWTMLRRTYGVQPGMRRATMFGRIICSPAQNGPPFWRYDAIGRNLLMSSYHLAPSNLPFYLKKLADYDPAEILGYASSIFLLAKQMLESPEPRLKPRVIFTTADKLLPQYRDIIEKAFGCPVIDQYGCAEMAIFAAQDQSGRFLVHPEHGYLEVVDAKGNPVGPGETGEAVCTGFVNRAMPMIRYRLGDRITLTDQASHAGSPVTWFQEVEGRVDDILISPDGRPLGRFSPIWKVVDGIFETQVIQNTPESLDIYLVVDDEYRGNPESEPALLAEIAKRTGPDMDTRLHYVEGIPKDGNGKFRTAISKVGRS